MSGAPTLNTTKVRMLVELEYDAEIMHSGEADKAAKKWFMENVLLDKTGLLLHSNEIGDTLGTVRVIEVHPF
jgi:hypothetical protein